MIVGCEVTSKKDAHLVQIALLHGSAVSRTDTWPAPPGQPEAVALREMSIRLADLLVEVDAETVALWRYEAPLGKVKVETARAKLRAEGVILMTACAAGAEVVELIPSSARRGGIGSNEALVVAALANVTGEYVASTYGRAITAASHAQQG